MMNMNWLKKLFRVKEPITGILPVWPHEWDRDCNCVNCKWITRQLNETATFFYG